MTFPNYHFFMSHYPFLSCCNYSTILINTFHYHAMGPHSYHQTCPTFDFDEQHFFSCGHDHIEQLSFGLSLDETSFTVSYNICYGFSLAPIGSRHIPIVCRIKFACCAYTVFHLENTSRCNIINLIKQFLQVKVLPICSIGGRNTVLSFCVCVE